MTDKIIQISKPGKLILLGEYAVLEQAPCLVAAVNRYCNVQIKPTVEDLYRIETSNPDIGDIEFVIKENTKLQFKDEINFSDRQRLRYVIAVLEYVIRLRDKYLKPAVIHIDTKKFYHSKSGEKLGFGASASLTVSLLAALYRYMGKPLSGIELYCEAHSIHRKAQDGLGSGSDIAASVFGGVIQYQMPKSRQNSSASIESLNWPSDLQVIPVWTGKSASTQDLIQRIKNFKDENPDMYQSIMRPMVELAADGCIAFKAGDIKEFLEIVNGYAKQEYKLGQASGIDIFSKVHQKIAAVVKRAGGVYKPSGAGIGDMGLAFCEGIESRLHIEESFKRSSFNIVNFSLQTHEI